MIKTVLQQRRFLKKAGLKENDSTKRYRRTAQEISDDKIRVAQMRVDALREMEEKRVATRKSRVRPSMPRQSQATNVVEESELRAPKKVVIRDESPPTPRPSANRKQALYDSWFTR